MEQTVQDQNVMIAAFEGRKFYGKHTIDKYGMGTSNAYPEIRYHESWDWLMPVVQKIVNADMDTFDSYALWVSDSLRTADIKQVYYAVCQYIENATHPSPQNQEK